MAKKFKILSISGGGIRGLFQANILSDLEKELGSPLANHFDLVTGTSTGAIVAAAVASEVSLDLIVNLFELKGTDVFKRQFRWNGPFSRKARYTCDELKAALAKTTAESHLEGSC